MIHKKLLNLINAQKDSGINLFTPTHNHVFTIVNFEWEGKKYLYLHNPKSHLLSIYDKGLYSFCTKTSIVMDHSDFITVFLNTLEVKEQVPSVALKQCTISLEHLELFDKTVLPHKEFYIKDNSSFFFKIPVSQEILELFDITNENGRVYLTIKDPSKISYQPKNCMFGSRYCEVTKSIYTNVPHRYKTIINKVTKDVVNSLEYPMKSFKHTIDHADEITKEQFRGSLKHLNNVLEYLTKFKNI